MPKSSTSFETFASPDELRAIVVDVEKYPEFLPEVKRVTVKDKSSDGFEATFFVEVKVGGTVVKTEYTVRYALQGETISWTLVSSPDVSKMEGHWKLEETERGGERWVEAKQDDDLAAARRLKDGREAAE